MNFAKKKKTTTACMSKKFDMVQRTMGVLRFPGHVYISFLNFYTMLLKNILRTFYAQNVKKIRTVQPQPQN